LKRRWPLARQLGAALALCVLVFAGIIIGAVEVWDQYEVYRVTASLPQTLRQVLVDMEAHRTPNPDALREMAAYSTAIRDDLQRRSNLALLAFTLIAALIAFALGIVLLRRIGRGLDDVAAMAARVSGGDLSARASLNRLASREEAALTESFNAMADTLQAAERELRENAAAIAHELRTPLTVLSGRLHGIIDGVFDASPDQIGALLHQTDALTRLVEDLRTLSLANSRQLQLQRAPTDLADEVRRVMLAVEPDLVAAGLVVTVHLSPAPLLADGARVRQLLGAILENARRYAAAGGELDVETGAIGTRAILRVLDRGPGLPEDGIERAFRYFWRADASRARYSGGSGLGLPVVRAIAEAHGGAATLAPRPGGGLEFTLDLPA
jgi:two-component system sensor histidine kinase AdeS